MRGFLLDIFVLCWFTYVQIWELLIYCCLVFCKWNLWFMCFAQVAFLWWCRHFFLVVLEQFLSYLWTFICIVVVNWRKNYKIRNEKTNRNPFACNSVAACDPFLNVMVWQRFWGVMFKTVIMHLFTLRFVSRCISEYVLVYFQSLEYTYQSILCALWLEFRFKVYHGFAVFTPQNPSFVWRKSHCYLCTCNMDDI